MEYLHKLSTVVDNIFNSDQEEDEIVNYMNNQEFNKCNSGMAKEYINRMSRRLLMDIFHPCSFLSSLPCHNNKNKDNIVKVLRAMAPLAMDICANIVWILASYVSHVKQSNSADMSDNSCLIPREYTLRAFLLFSTWLPIAPQLSSLASDLFHRREFTNPLYYLDSDVNNIKEIPEEWKHLVARAAHYLIKFYVDKGEKKYLKDWWDWSPLFVLLNYQEENTYVNNISLECHDDKNKNKMGNNNINSDTNIKCLVSKPQYYQHLLAAKWHAGRAVSYILPLSSHSRYQYLERLHLQDEIVPWVIHPYKVLDEDISYQELMVKSQSLLLLNHEEVVVPTSEEIRKVLLLPSILAHVGNGLVFYRNGGVDSIFLKDISISISNTNYNRLIYTKTTMHNLMLLGMSLSSCEIHPRPILVIGPASCGKSTLIRQLSKLTNNKLIELHIDDQTDSKTLLGSYTVTDIVGEFVWKPGILTMAARNGLWILLEDLDTCTLDVQAAIVKLLEERILPLSGDGMGGRIDERCHPNFRLWATYCSNKNQIKIAMRDPDTSRKRFSLTIDETKNILHPGLWRKVHVNPLPYDELRELGMKLHLNVAEILLEKILQIFCRLDHLFNKEMRGVELKEQSQIHPNTSDQTIGYNSPSYVSKHIHIRDYLKLLNRISHSISLEPNASYITESQRMICLLETFDVLASSMSCPQQRRHLVFTIVAPIWGVNGDTAIHYIESRRPDIECSNEYVKIGRCRIQYRNRGYMIESSITNNIKNDNTIKTYVDTDFSLRLMESVAVCVSRK